MLAITKKSTKMMCFIILYLMSSLANGYTSDYWLEEGKDYQRLGFYEKAIECYNNALNMDNLYIDAWYNKGVSYINLLYNEAVNKFANNRSNKELDEKFLSNDVPNPSFGESDHFRISPDGNHIAYLISKNDNSDWFLCMDGEEESFRWDNIYNITFSPDSKELAYIAKDGDKYRVIRVDVNSGYYDLIYMLSYDFIGDRNVWFYTDKIIGLIFSPDSRHLAYNTYSKGNNTVVVDWKKIAEHKDGSPLYPLIFSPDGNHIAYIVKLYNESGCYVIFDGKKHKTYRDIQGLIFSPDSNRISYIASQSGKQCVVVDDRENKWFYLVENDYTSPSSEHPVFSPDSKHLAYRAAVERVNFENGSVSFNNWSIILDGKARDFYDTVSIPVFSPNSKHLGFAAFKNNSIYIIIDDTKYKIADLGYNLSDHEGISDLTFSPNSELLAYTLFKNDIWMVGVIGKDNINYSFIYSGYHFPINKFVFSPNSKRLAYKTIQDDGEAIVLNGTVGKKYDKVGEPIFSPNSQHLAYIAVSGKNQSVIVDNKEYPQYRLRTEYDTADILPESDNPTFSPDSEHFAYRAALNGSGFYMCSIVLDGNEGKRYEYILTQPTFDSNDSLHYLALKIGNYSLENNMFLINDENTYLVNEKW